MLNEKIVETKANLTEVVDDVIVAGEQVATNFAEAVVEIGNVVTIATKVATEGIKEISIESATATITIATVSNSGTATSTASTLITIE